MTVIRIQEHSESAGVFQAKVSFDQGPEYDITVRDPFSKEEEERLEWYFEKYLKFPFTDQVKAQEAATSITTYGEKLFAQVFSADPQILSAYKTTAKAGLGMIQIEIVGQLSFHALHWEALKDPELPHPLTLQATIVRKNMVPQVVPLDEHPSPTINLLIVAARPRGKRDVGYRTISRPLVESLRQSRLPVKIDILRPGTYNALENHLHEVTSKHGGGYYHVIHFDVHGSLLTYQEFRLVSRHIRDQGSGRRDIPPYDGLKAFLALEGKKDDTADLVEAEELAALLTQHQIPIAILNACQSGKQTGDSEISLGSSLMQAGVQLVLAMGYSITVSAATLLMTLFYRRIFAGDNLLFAIRQARNELYNYKKRNVYYAQQIDLEDWLLPVVYQNRPVQLTLRELTPEENRAYFERQAQLTHEAPPEPTYGFIGRDLDILRIERRLLMKRNIVLVRGMGGAGKTTLLRYLSSWWHMTGLVERVFYFGYDERAWTPQQITVEIAQQLLDPVAYVRDFQPLSLDAQQVLLTRRLRAESHLLILDNLESITGANPAILHTLDKAEQEALRCFLADLAGGQTLVLLGSRSGEEWLAKGTFADNVYDLPGLDPEAASTLADLILEQHGAAKCLEDGDFLRLLKLLDGFPLALEVVLPNLARETPKEVLTALQAGDVRLDTGDPEDKTKSILRCIDYSYSNLSPEAQELLLCIAPFTSVFDVGLLEPYIAHLKQLPSLKQLPFAHFVEILQEAVNWGLLSPDSDNPRFLHMQPVLSYFLRNRLKEPGQAESKAAIETAFLEHYREFGSASRSLLRSRDPQDRRLGQFVTKLEYENLVTALNLALVAQESITALSATLAYFLSDTQNQHLGLKLFYTIQERFADYPSDKLAGSLGIEYAEVIRTIANWQLDLKQYKNAEQSYQRVLKITDELDRVDEESVSSLKGGIYRQLGKVAREQQQWAQAEQYYQQALQIFVECNNRDGQAQAYYSLGYCSQEQQQWAQAEQYYQQALQIYVEYNDRHMQAYTYQQLGGVAQGQQQWAQAEQYYWQALRIYVEYNDRYTQASIYHQLGCLAQEQQQWAQAEQYYQQALQILVEYNDRYKQAYIYHNLGGVIQEQRQWAQARDYFLQALEIFAAFGDTYRGAGTLTNLAHLWRDSEDAGLPTLVAEKLRITTSESEELLCKALRESEGSHVVATLNNMAGMYQATGRPQNALRLFEQALSIAREVGDRAGEATTLNNMAGVYYMIDRPQEALRLFEQALSIAREVGDRAGEATTLNNMANVYQATDCPQEALRLFEQSLLITKEVGDRAGEATTLNNMAAVYQATDRPQEALRLFEQALPMRHEVDDRAGVAATLVNMAILLYQDVQRPQEAIANMEQALAILRASSLPQDTAGRAPEQVAALLQAMRFGTFSHGQERSASTIPTKQIEIIVGTTIVVMTTMQEHYAEWREAIMQKLQDAQQRGPDWQSKVEFLTVPGYHAEWREAIMQELQDAQQRGPGWQSEVEFFTAIIALLDGQSPMFSADHPYAQTVAAIQNRIAKGGIVAASLGGGTWQPFRLLDGQSPTFSADHPYAQTVAAIQNGIAKGGIVAVSGEVLAAFVQACVAALRSYRTQWQKLAGDRPLIAAVEEVRANSLAQLATIAKEQGKYEEAQGLYQQSLDIFKQQEDQRGQAAILLNLGEIALQRGEYKEARDLYWQCSEVYKRLGDESGRAGILFQLGAIAQDQEKDEEAQSFFQQSLEVFEQLGNESGRASCLGRLGMIAYLQEKDEEAQRLYQQSLAIFKQLEDQGGQAGILYCLGGLAYAQEDFEKALMYLIQAYIIFDVLLSPARAPVQDMIIDIHNRMDEETFMTQWRTFAGDRPLVAKTEQEETEDIDKNKAPATE